jgi:hypothetical protein
MLLEQKKTVGCNPNCQDIACRLEESHVRLCGSTGKTGLTKSSGQGEITDLGKLGAKIGNFASGSEGYEGT